MNKDKVYSETWHSVWNIAEHTACHATHYAVCVCAKANNTIRSVAFNPTWVAIENAKEIAVGNI